MDALALSQLLTSLANGVAAFAALQNLAYAYSLGKREAKIVIEDDRKRWMLVGTGLFNLAYLSAVWWLSVTALTVLSSDDYWTRHILNALTFGRCAAVVVLAAVPMYLIWRYDDQRYWIRERERHARQGTAEQS
jgi:hypothetical protein